ncbi:MAG: ABC transporter permease, partial [Bryobacteraceae bacterium]
HLDLQIAANVAAGMSSGEARGAALREFGGVAQRMEECRDARGWSWLDGLAQDLRQGLRGLRRNPVFTAVAVISLGLGMGANGALFSVVNAVLLRPLPLPQAERIVAIQEFRPDTGQDSGSNPARVTDWGSQTTGLAATGGYYREGLVLTGREAPRRLWAIRTCGQYLAVLGVQPVAGRLFTVEEERGHGEAVAVLSEGAWEREFGRDPKVVGAAITFSGKPFTLVGVLPAGIQENIDVWAPMPLEIMGVDRKAGFAGVVARMKPGVTLAQVQTELGTVAGRLALQYPDTDAKRGVRSRLLRDELVQDARTPLLILLGTVGLVLLIACANVTGLLLSRASGRRREAAIRVALGAGRGRLLRLFLTEGLLLSLAGGACGLLVAVEGLDLLKVLLPADLPRLAEARVDGALILFLFGLALACGILAGILPAWQASRAAVAPGLKEGGAGTSGVSRQWMRRVLVAAEVTISMMLLVGTMVLSRSFVNVARQPLGFRPQSVLAASVNLPWDTPEDKLAAFQKSVLEKLSTLAGVRAAGLIDQLPLEGGSQGMRLIVRNRPLPGNSNWEEISLRACSPGYFAAAGIPLLAGRNLAERAQPDGARTVVVNQTFARKYFGSGDAIGQFIGFNPPTPKNWYEIVGMVGDVRQNATKPMVAEAFVLSSDTYWPLAKYVIRAEGDPRELMTAVRRAVQEVDPQQPVDKMVLLESTVDKALLAPRLQLWVVGGFSGLALLLAAIGLYGVLAYDVAQRTQEIGVRIALGADPEHVLWEAIRRGLLPVAAGVVPGIAGALALGKLLDGQLVGLRVADPFSFAGAALLLAAAAVAACYVPARRASRIDPLVALRHE